MLRAPTTVVCWALALVMAAAALGKLLDWSSWTQSIGSFTLLPPWLADATVTVLPAAECVPLLLMITGFSKISLLAVACLLTIFTGVLWLHAANNIEPTCACLGLWNRFLEVQSTTSSGLNRNGVLLGLAALNALLMGLNALHTRPSPSSADQRASR